MQEKSLIKIEKLSIFQKISRFFIKLFNKNKTDEIPNINTIEQNTNIRQEFKEKQNIINLQNEYENGNISEELISEENKEKLLELYKEQIKTLENNIASYRNTLKNYNEKIVRIREKIESTN